MGSNIVAMENTNRAMIFNNLLIYLARPEGLEPPTPWFEERCSYCN